MRYTHYCIVNDIRDTEEFSDMSEIISDHSYFCKAWDENAHQGTATVYYNTKNRDIGWDRHDCTVECEERRYKRCDTLREMFMKNDEVCSYIAKRETKLGSLL